nr:MAG TPA: hypothetical protein [Caudoviricetes sp.]
MQGRRACKQALCYDVAVLTFPPRSLYNQFSAVKP